MSSNWQDSLHDTPTPWLLESASYIRYNTLIHLLGKSPNLKEVLTV